MKNPLPLLLAALLLASCNLVVTTPERPQLSLAVPALVGRWHHLDKAGNPDPNEHLVVSPADDLNHYDVVFYTGEREEDRYRIVLCPDNENGRYWGFARQEAFSGGYLLFHLALRGREAEFRWLDADKTESLLSSAGLPFDLQRETGFVHLSNLEIHAPWKELLEVLNGKEVDVLDSERVLFRRGAATGNGRTHSENRN